MATICCHGISGLAAFVDAETFAARFPEDIDRTHHGEKQHEIGVESAATAACHEA
jgi:hypothetical protein